MGDFNINLFENSSNTRKFEENFMCTGLQPTISITTHHKPNCKKSCIDNIFLKNLDTENMCTGTITTHISHHRSLFAIIVVKNKPKDSIIATPKKITHNYNDKNIASLNKLLKHELNEQVPVNFETFTSILRDCIDRTCKMKNPKISKRTKENNPWITQGLISAISKRDCLYIKWLKTVSNRCKSGNPMLREQFKKYRNMLASLIKLGKQTYYKNKFTETNGDKKKMWKLINNLRGKSASKISSSFKIRNDTVNCKHKITETFNEHFCSLAENLNKQIPNNIDKRFTQYLPSPTESSMFLYESSLNEITQIISELKNGKPSDLPICLIKKIKFCITPTLCDLYNKCMISGKFPETLKVGRITPIYKKGTKNDISNYRPVSTLPLFGKIFEKIIYTRMYDYLTNRNLNPNWASESYIRLATQYTTQ